MLLNSLVFLLLLFLFISLIMSGLSLVKWRQNKRILQQCKAETTAEANHVYVRAERNLMRSGSFNLNTEAMVYASADYLLISPLKYSPFLYLSELPVYVHKGGAAKIKQIKKLPSNQLEFDILKEDTLARYGLVAFHVETESKEEKKDLFKELKKWNKPRAGKHALLPSL